MGYTAFIFPLFTITAAHAYARVITFLDFFKEFIITYLNANINDVNDLNNINNQNLEEVEDDNYNQAQDINEINDMNDIHDINDINNNDYNYNGEEIILIIKI